MEKSREKINRTSGLHRTIQIRFRNFHIELWIDIEDLDLNGNMFGLVDEVDNLTRNPMDARGTSTLASPASRRPRTGSRCCVSSPRTARASSAPGWTPLCAWGHGDLSAVVQPLRLNSRTRGLGILAPQVALGMPWDQRALTSTGADATRAVTESGR